MRYRHYRHSLIALVFLLLLMPQIFSLDITKKTDKTTYTVGEPIYVTYTIRNDNSQPVDFILTDETIIETYGYNISCLRLQDIINPEQRQLVSAGLPPNQELPIPAKDLGIEFSAQEPGKYTLAGARIIYKDPVLGLVEEKVSDPVKIEIIGEKKDYVKEIRPYNFCSEQSKEDQQKQQQQQENQPSKEERQKEMEEQQKKQQEMQQEMQENYQQMSDQEKKMAHSQQSMNQDSNALKQSMEKDRIRHEQMQKEFSENVQQNEDVQKMIEEMEEEGFEVTNQSMNARTNTSGDFSVQMENKETGEKTEIKGNLHENKTQNLMNTKEIAQNENLQNLQKNLEEMGFQPEEPQMQGNRFNQQFQNPQTGETAQIKGDIEKGELTNAEASFESKKMLEKILNNEQVYNQDLAEAVHKKMNTTDISSSFRMQQVAGEEPELSGIGNNSVLKKPVPFNATTGQLLKKPQLSAQSPWFTAATIILLIILTILGYYITKKKREKEKKKEGKNKLLEKKKVNYKKISQEMLADAQRLYSEGHTKDAYGKAAHAVRFYYSYHLKEYKEFSNMETIKLLKRNSLEFKKTQDCFNLCTLVEFAKYEANDKDFSQIISIAKKLINSN
jgi:hypothetical protein